MLDCVVTYQGIQRAVFNGQEFIRQKPNDLLGSANDDEGRRYVPNDAFLVEISERLSAASLGKGDLSSALDLDSTYLEAARTMLAALKTPVASRPFGFLTLSDTQVQAYLDFDPDFIETAKKLLHEFVERSTKKGE